ncbi:MAG: dTDP-glucose pyrophosphorylase [Chloroflexi bacterium]|nr:dTDP-glucose pyrophosphorylase [Chloroflexota bacterium]
MGSEDVVGIIPAAGKGRRLAPYPLPKELFPIGHQLVEVEGQLQQRPMVVSQYLIEAMVAAQLNRLYIVLGPGKLDIVEYYRNGEAYGVPFAYVFQSEARGMPYALDLVSPWLKGNETILMGMPDTIIEPRDAFNRLLNAHRTWKADLTLGLFPTERPQKFGMIGINAAHDVIAHQDKPRQTDLKWLWGITCWGPAFTTFMHETLEQEGREIAARRGREPVLGDIFDLALARGLRVKGLPFEDGRYIDIGTYDDLRQAVLLYA